MGETKKPSVSMPEDLFSRASTKAKALGYASFSEYIQFLLREDLDKNSQHIVVRDERGIHYRRRDRPGIEALEDEDDDPLPPLN